MFQTTHFKKIFFSIFLCTTAQSVTIFRTPKDVKHFALDLGTRNSILYEAGNAEPLFNEASAMSYFEFGKNRKLDRIGNSALSLIDRCPPNKKAVRMIQDGTIQKVWQAEMFLRGMFEKAGVLSQISANSVFVVGIPGVIKSGEALSVEKAASRIGFKPENVRLVHEPIAAMIGEGVDVFGDEAVMVADGGGGTFDILVVSQGGILSNSERTFDVAGDAMDKSIQEYVLRTFKAEISLEKAQELKKSLGTVLPKKDSFRKNWLSSKESDNAMAYDSEEVIVKDLLTKCPVTITVTREDIAKAIEPCIVRILNEIITVIQGVSAEAGADVKKGGILLAGGSSLLQGFAYRIQEETGIKTRPAKDGLRCIALGLKEVVENQEKYKQMMLSTEDF